MVSQAVAEGLYLLPSPLFSLLLQVVHLDNMKHEEEIQKLPLQPPYYDMAASEPSPYTDKLVRRQEASSAPASLLSPRIPHPTKPKTPKARGCTSSLQSKEHPIPEHRLVALLQHLPLGFHRSSSWGFRGHSPLKHLSSSKSPSEDLLCRVKPPVPPRSPPAAKLRECLQPKAAAPPSNYLPGRVCQSLTQSTSSLNPLVLCGFVQPRRERDANVRQQQQGD